MENNLKDVLSYHEAKIHKFAKHVLKYKFKYMGLRADVLFSAVVNDRTIYVHTNISDGKNPPIVMVTKIKNELENIAKSYFNLEDTKIFVTDLTLADFRATSARVQIKFVTYTPEDVTGGSAS